jgi:hypothetical protein
MCSGDSVMLYGSGANSYTWSGGITDSVTFASTSATTTYTVVGTISNNCTDTTTITLTVNMLPTVIANASNDTICAGSNLTLTGAGANAYAWTNGVNDGISFMPDSTRTYVVTGTDVNNCVDTDTITVALAALPTVMANTTDDTVCAGINITLTGSGTATSYAWSGGASNGVAFAPAVGTTTYTVTGTNAASCSATASISITANPMPNVTVTDAAPLLTANQAGAAYTWIDCSTNTAIGGATNQSYSVVYQGDYKVEVNLNGCVDTSICVTVTTVDVNLAGNSKQFAVYPNPSAGHILVQAVSEAVYTIVNELGQTVYSFQLNAANNYEMNIDGLSNGIYMIIGTDKNNQRVQQRLVVAQ